VEWSAAQCHRDTAVGRIHEEAESISSKPGKGLRTARAQLNWREYYIQSTCPVVAIPLM
jgi:hypothetical protein